MLWKKIKTWASLRMQNMLYLYRRRNFYYRILVPFAVLSTVIVCVSTVSAWFLMNRRLEENLRGSNYRILEQVCQYTDNALYTAQLRYLNRVFLGGVASQIDDFFSYGEQLPGDIALRTFRELGERCTQEEYLTNITLYNQGADMLLDNSVGLRYHASGTAWAVAPYLPFDDYLACAQSAEGGLACLTAPEMTSAARTGFTLIKTIPMYSPAANQQGYIAFCYDGERLVRDLYQRYGLNGALMVLSPQDTPVLRTDDFVFDPDVLYGEVLDRDTPQTYTYFTHEGTRYCMVRIRSEETGWTYLSYLPVDVLNAEAHITRQLLLLLTVFTVLVCNFLVHCISKKVYRPIHALSSRFRSRSQLPVSADGLSVIEEALTFLENQMDDVKRLAGENREILCYKTLIRLLYHNDFVQSELAHTLDLCGVRFTEEGFCVAVIEFDHRVFDSLAVEEREYLSERTLVLMQEQFGTEMPVLSAVHPDRQAVLLVNLREEQYADLCAGAPQLVACLRSRLHIQVNYALSDFAAPLQEVHHLYRDCQNALRYSFIYEYGNVFLPQFVRGWEQTAFCVSPQELFQMETLLREGRSEELESALTGAADAIRDGKCSLADANRFVTEVYGAVLRVCTDTGVLQDPACKAQVAEGIQNAATLRDSMEGIYLMVRMYCAAMNETLRRADSDFIDRVSEYIRAHCREDITLVSVAQAFRVTPSHLSRLFKSVRGENFSGYVVEQKLQLAAQMLLEQPEESIAQIAEALGYYTPAYFSRLFKERFGVTPSQYRKNNGSGGE